MKHCKIFCKAQTAIHLKEIIQPPPSHSPPDKILLRLRNKNSLKEIWINIQTFASKCFENAVRWRQEMVQCKYVCWKICKVKKGFGYKTLKYKMFYARNYLFFKKGFSNCEILNHLNFGLNFSFLGDCFKAF